MSQQWLNGECSVSREMSDEYIVSRKTMDCITAWLNSDTPEGEVLCRKKALLQEFRMMLGRNQFKPEGFEGSPTPAVK